MPLTYDNFGIKFAYPDNWELSQDEDPALPRTISLHSPTGAFWSTTLQSLADDSHVIMQQIREAFRDEYDEVEFEPFEGKIVDYSIVNGFELRFYCLDLMVVARVMLLEVNGFWVTLVYQGENRDFDDLASVFDAISFNMIQNMELVDNV